MQLSKVVVAVVVAVLVLVLAVGVVGQQLPDAPTPQLPPPSRTVDKAFVTVVAATMGSAVLDAWSTNRNLDHGYIEHNIILGERPAHWNVWALTLGEAAAWSTVAYIVKKKTANHPDKWVRRAWLVFPTLSFGGHTYCGLHNIAIYDPIRYPKPQVRR